MTVRDAMRSIHAGNRAASTGPRGTHALRPTRPSCVDASTKTLSLRVPWRRGVGEKRAAVSHATDAAPSLRGVPRLVPNRLPSLTGSETFQENGRTVLEFWRWALGD